MSLVKRILPALAGFWRKSRISILIVALLALGVIIAGLHDVGIVMGILGAVVILAEITRRWRRARNFIIMFFASFFGIILLAFLDEEVVKPMAHLSGGDAAVNGMGFQVFNQLVSLIILFFGVAGLLTGFFGTVISGIFNLAVRLKKAKTKADA